MNFTYIADNKELEHCITSLNNCTEIAIDLEFDKNRYRYGFNLCLMQIYTGKECFLIDPLSRDLEIEKVFPVLEDPEIQKVVFAFGEDLRLLHSIGCFPKNIYDLDVVTSLLNYAPASLTSFLKEIAGIEVGKSSQQSNWFKRPLSERQLHYAAEDVIYLFHLKEVLLKQAHEAGITNWIAEENSMFDDLDFSDQEHNMVLKQKDKKDLSMFEWFVFSRLMEFIDGKAKKLNKPAYFIIDKNFLYDISREPSAIDGWENVNGIYKSLRNENFINELKAELVASIAEAETLGLSRTDRADQPLSREEYLALRDEQRKIGMIKNQIFIPIQQRLEEDFGRNVKSYILSNRQMKEIITGECRIPDYKKELFRKYAEELQLDISPFINEEKKAS